MSTGRSGGHSAKPAKAANDPGRCMHPNPTVRTQAGEKRDPTVPPKSGKDK